MQIKIFLLLNSIIFAFSNIKPLEVFNNSGLNLKNIEFIIGPEMLQVGFIKNLDVDQKTIITPDFNNNINHLIIKLNDANQEQAVTHINKRLGGPVTLNRGQIIFESVPGITFAGSPVSNLKATYRTKK